LVEKSSRKTRVSVIGRVLSGVIEIFATSQLSGSVFSYRP